jgi:hypothetical protein
MKKLIKYALGILGYTMIMATPVAAFSDAVYIQDLPEYINYQAFKLSYTAISEGDVTAKFMYKKDGDSGWTDFSTVTGYSGEVQFGGSQINDQKKYYFRVEINGNTVSDETSTFYDASGPSPVNSYSKEKVSDGFYRLHWKNPTDTDFSRVFIYRSDKSTFTADDSTKVAEKGGSPDTEQTWDNPGLDLSKTYYYAIRAVDKAGNPSSVVADSDSQVQVLGVAATAGVDKESKVASLPKEDKSGSVLGEEQVKDDSKASENAQDKGLVSSIKSIGYPKLAVIALIIIGLGSLVMGYLKKEKE